jgi:hypothetical protein
VHWNARGNAIAAHAVEPLARQVLGCAAAATDGARR